MNEQRFVVTDRVWQRLEPHLPGEGQRCRSKAFDANWLLEEVDGRGATAVIPPKSNRRQQRDYDADAYKWRHLVENYFAKIKEFRGIATRYDKTDCSYTANSNLIAALITSR